MEFTTGSREGRHHGDAIGHIIVPVRETTSRGKGTRTVSVSLQIRVERKHEVLFPNETYDVAPLNNDK
jgi:hypothetical protein